MRNSCTGTRCACARKWTKYRSSRTISFPTMCWCRCPAVRRKQGALWVAAELAQALVLAGLGSKSWPGLHRVSAVRKSATAAHGARPTVALHYHSFGIEQPSFRADSLVLIDDVITKGRTLLAAASRVREAFPDAQIRAFALAADDGADLRRARDCSSRAEAKFAGEQGTRGEFREIQPQPYNALRLRIDLKTPPAGRPLQDLAPSAIAARLAARARGRRRPARRPLHS